MKVEPLKTTWARDKIPKNPLTENWTSKSHIISTEFLRSFLRHHFAGKPVVAAQNVGYFFQAKYSGLVSFLFLLHFTLGGVTDLFSLTYFQAAQKAHKEVVELLLDLDSSLVKVKDKNGRKPADFVPSHEQELRDMLKAE